MRMVLPASYVAIEQEEMMYLDGGLSLYKWVVSAPINIAFNASLGGGAVSLALGVIRAGGTAAFKKTLVKAIGKFVAVQTANRIAGRVVNSLAGFASWSSIGGAIANIWDKFDQKPNNNRLNLF